MKYKYYVTYLPEDTEPLFYKFIFYLASICERAFIPANRKYDSRSLSAVLDCELQVQSAAGTLLRTISSLTFSVVSISSDCSSTPSSSAASAFLCWSFKAQIRLRVLR